MVTQAAEERSGDADGETPAAVLSVLRAGGVSAARANSRQLRPDRLDSRLEDREGLIDLLLGDH